MIRRFPHGERPSVCRSGRISAPDAALSALFSKQLRSEYGDGTTIEELATRYRITESAVILRINRSREADGLQTIARERIEKDVDAMLNDYLSGMSYASIARKYNRSYSHAWKQIVDAYAQREIDMMLGRRVNR